MLETTTQQPSPNRKGRDIGVGWGLAVVRDTACLLCSLDCMFGQRHLILLDLTGVRNVGCKLFSTGLRWSAHWLTQMN